MPGDHLRRWSAADGVTTFRKPCDKSNGLTWDREGRLLACEHATSRVTRTERDGRIVPLATHYQGKELNSPNDIVCAADGGIYFTDPPYGRMRRSTASSATAGARVSRACTGWAPDPTSPALLADDFDRPNGLCFSLDGARLFVNDTARKHIRVFDVKPDGGLAGGAVWAETKGEGAGAPDGMKLDSAGNVYCCGPGGIHVFIAGRGLPRGDPGPGAHRELRVGRRRPPLAVHHRLHVGVPYPRAGAGAARPVTRPTPNV